MGGRIAEQLVLGQLTTGASNDFERATQIARNMVTMWGMSDELGAMVYGEREEEIFLGREITRTKNISETTAQKIDLEVRHLIDSNYERSKKILEDHMDKLHLLAEALIEYETLDGEEVDLVLAGKKLVRTEAASKAAKAPPPSDKPTAAAPDTDSTVSNKEAGQGV